MPLGDADVGELSVARDERLDRLIRREVVDAGVAPTAAVGWARRGLDGRWALAVGGDADCIFDLASVTKPLTAIVAARAVAEGVLAWSARVGAVLPELSASAAAEARLIDLLAHRAGLPAWGAIYLRDPWAATTTASLPPDGAALDLPSLHRRAASRVEPADTTSVYSDLGYVLAGAMIARATRTPLAVKWQGFGAATSAALRRAADPSFDERVVATELVAWRGGIVRGEVHDENASFLERAGGDPGHAGAFGAVDEVARVAIAFIEALSGRDERLLPASVANEMITPRPGGSHRVGWDSPTPGRSSSGARFGARSFGHLGFTGTSVWADPEAQAVAVLLTNRIHPSRDNLKIREARPRIHDALWSL